MTITTPTITITTSSSSISRLDEYGKSIYKTRWKGYTANDDTWEPIDNVASTGHVDRYERLQRQKSLFHFHGGNGNNDNDTASGGGGDGSVAVIEYDDGEREMVDMAHETFRAYRDDDEDDDDEDDIHDDNNVSRRGKKRQKKITIDVDPTMNDYSLLTPGNNIEILWKHANMYFPCKVITWTAAALSSSSRRVVRSGRTATTIASSSSSFKNNTTNDSSGVGIGGISNSHNNNNNNNNNNNREQPKVGKRSTRRLVLDDTAVKEDIKVDIPKQEQQQQQQTKKQLSFEELWTLKLKRTQEFMYNVKTKKN